MTNQPIPGAAGGSDPLARLVGGDEAPGESIEQRMVVAMTGVGERIVKRPDIIRAMNAAAQLKPGRVIASEVEAVEMADLAAQVIDGERVLEAQVKDALRIPKRMEEAVRGVVKGPKEFLQRARETANRARVAWQVTLRARAAKQAADLRQEALEAARIAAEAAAVTGEDAPPPAEIAPIEVPRTVAGGTGKMGTMVSIFALEIVELEAVPRDWLVLVSASAKAGFVEAERAGLVKKPEPGEVVVYKGVRFEARESAVNRR
jgi:hypothetical protein